MTRWRSRVQSTGHIHFYVPNDIASDVAGWDPDREPQRFASGLGHNLLELFARLRARGLVVTIGRSIPSDTGLVVYFQHAWDRLGELRLAMRAAPFHTAVIRSDAPLWWWNLLPAELTVVPNTMPVWEERLGASAQHLPAFPQRGMVVRDPTRVGVRTVTFKGNPESVPGYLLDPSFRTALEGRGVELLLDTPDRTDGGDQFWHDFHDADVVLCLRGAASDDPLTNKPATRLVNAWCAGAIPLVAPEPAYLELVRDGEDALVVSDGASILGALDRLADDPGLVRQLFAASRARAEEFRTEVLLDRWTTALVCASGPRYDRAETTRRRLLVVARFALWAARALLRRAKELTRRGAARLFAEQA